MKKCEKQVDGKHIVGKEIITHTEVSNGYRVVMRIPVYAERCLACGKWIKLLTEEGEDKNVK